MAYLDPDHAAQGDVAISTWPDAGAPGNGVSMAGALKWLNDAVQGGPGVVTYPAAAAPANGVSLAEVLRAIYNLVVPNILTGVTDIDDSAQTETTAFPILTIEPAAGAPLADVEICLDLDKATTGFGAVETSITVQFALERKIDGTNWRREPYVEAALSGTNAGNGDRMVRLQAGSVGVTEDVRVVALFSSDVTADMEIPYTIAYKGIAAPTVTAIAA
jgi:hypothetical protein